MTLTSPRPLPQRAASRCLFWVCALVLLAPSLGQAEHTPEHRFTIYGYVYDETGTPRPGPIVIKDTSGNILGTTATSSSGYYQVRLHLHSSDLGEKLVVRSEAGQKELTVQFDPNNKTAERKAEVNFGVIPPSTGLLGNSGILVGGAMLLAAGMGYAISRKRKNRTKPYGKKKQKAQHHR